MPMGKRGPKAAPLQLKVVRGDQESRINRDEPIPAEADVKAPGWLSGEALEVWEYYAEDLEDKGCLTVWDVDTFAVYCTAVAVYRDCARKLGQDYIAQGGAGGKIKSPYWQIMRDAAETIKKFSASFGFTPGDRASLRVDLAGDGPAMGAERILG
jgi:P27 family predicted phage terminase small subunit